MRKLFSDNYKFLTWRKLWIYLCVALKKLGLDITEEQIDEMKANMYKIDYETVRKEEEEVKHDVMAHIRAFAKLLPKSGGVLHLGATSCYVTDNADLIIQKEALNIIINKLKQVIKSLGRFAQKYRTMPAVGYTHYQPAQLVTVGKRACMWIQDFLSDLKELSFMKREMKFLGAKGATGTQASYLQLFSGDKQSVINLDEILTELCSFRKCFIISGQTYTRKQDEQLVKKISGIATSVCKMSTDIRLLAHDGEIYESFGAHQVGSSAMPYKKNPKNFEKLCGLAQVLINQCNTAQDVATSQWLERTLNDSAARRIYLPQVFLCADAMLDDLLNLCDKLEVNELQISRNVQEHLPFMFTENVMMEMVKAGANRQECHEKLRSITIGAKFNGIADNVNIEIIRKISEDPYFAPVHDSLQDLMSVEKIIGMAPYQVLAFLDEEDIDDL